MPNLPSQCSCITHRVIQVKSLEPRQLWATFVILMFYFILYPCLALSSSSHSACAIQRYHILPVTRRLHLLCHRAPPPSLLSLWQLRAAQSPHKMPTRRAGIREAVCGPRIASAVPSTAPQTAWTALRRSQWPWSRQRPRGMRLWVATPPSRRVTRQCWCPRLRSTWKPHVPLSEYRYREPSPLSRCLLLPGLLSHLRFILLKCMRAVL